MVAPATNNLVLVVEDEPLIVRMVTMTLSMGGFRAAVAENGEVGYEMFTLMREQICLVLADVMMPVCNGVVMADRIRAADPKMPILLVTGYSDHALVTEAQTRYPLIRKPFLPADLMRRIRSSLDASEAATG